MQSTSAQWIFDSKIVTVTKFD